MVVFFSFFLKSLSVLQEAQGSKKMISNLNVVMDASNLRSFSSILSG